MQEHPITPPPELVQQWHHNWKQLSREKLTDFPECIATQAARWGADQELEACCKWLDIPNNRHDRGDGWLLSCRLHAARRPPSLKQKALDILDQSEWSTEEEEIIRKALNTIPD